ncbi:MAG: hypothetical protein ACTH30_00575 [Leucobacter sp.]
MRVRTRMRLVFFAALLCALTGCTGGLSERHIAPAETLELAPPFLDDIVQELVGYIPSDHIEESWYDPEEDQTRSTMFCSADLDGVSDYISITRGATLWSDDTVDLIEVTKQIEADYSAKPGWSVTRPQEGYSGPEITVHSPERYMFNIGIRPDSNYFSIGAWSPCFPAPPEHRSIHKY